MKTPTSSSLLPVTFLLLLSSFSWAASADTHENFLGENFLQCLHRHTQNSSSISKVIYTPNNSSYTNVLTFSVRNLRFNTSSTPKPQVIVTPVDESQVQTVIYCAKEHDMQIRIRSGGHDFEGLSYISEVPFVSLDMINIRSINVDLKTSTAWVEAGATWAELYYRVYQKSGTHAFPGGIWATVGVTGFLCGGGHGTLARKYGLGADHVIDARLIDVNGRILNRKSMGEDLFWAIRGGGCSSFGVILSWKLKLVSVPETITIFDVPITLEQNVIKILHQWQYVAPNLPKDLDIIGKITTVLSNSSTRADNKTVEVVFEGFFLGGIDELLPLMQERFPELGLMRENCSEVSWIKSVMHFASFDLVSNDSTPEDLLDRHFVPDIAFKAKSDLVREPISEKGLNGIFERLLEVEPGATTLDFVPFGGRMSEIPESAIPFPHRAGILYLVFMDVLWIGNTTEKLNWIRSLYNYMTPYVTKNPRTAYVNYIDLDLGVNNPRGHTSYEQASKWGKSYFKDNFDRLVQVKTMVDPSDFFRFEQSIPPLSFPSDT